jgi:hypothetical protein
MINKVMIGLAAAAFVFTPPLVGAATKAGTETVKGGTETGGGEKGGGRSATHLKHKSSIKHKAYGYAKHKPVTSGHSKGKFKA